MASSRRCGCSPTPATLEAGCARLVALGAVRVRLLPADDDNESCIVMQDIEGNEFCLD
ncbi:MAG TPA: VOC family protein [Jiangellaceae bacterium]